MAASLFFLLSGVVARGASDSEYNSRLWLMEDGLPYNVVQSLLQTRDGFLWVGTREGLARFDGVRFTPVSLPGERRFNSITALTEAADGAVWIGTQDAGVFRIAGGRVAEFTLQEGLPHLQVRGFGMDGAGTLWVLTAAGLAKFTEDHFVADRSETNQNSYKGFCFDAGGNLWITTGGALHRKAGSVRQTYNGRNGLAIDSARSLLPARNGDLWIGFDGGVSRFHDGSFTHTIMAGHGPSVMANVLHETRDGGLWVGTYDGVYRLAGGAFVREGNLDTPFLVRVIYEDREGTVWVGGDEGLRRFNRKRYTVYTREQGLPYDRSVSMCQDAKGSMWIGTWGGGISSFRDGVFTVFNQANGLAGDYVHSVHAADDGIVWVGLDYGGGLNRIDARGGIVHYGREEGLVATTITAIQHDITGGIWVGTREGLFRLREEKFTRYLTKDGLLHPQINELTRRRRGGLWVGTQKGLMYWENEQLSPVHGGGRVIDDAIAAIYEDPENTLWLGTRGRGLKWITQDKVVTCGTAEGLTSDFIYSIVEDDRNQLWLSTSRGIISVNKVDLEEFAKGNRQRVTSMDYGRHEGMPSTGQSAGGPQPAAWKSQDGRLWFRALRGVVVLDPRQMSRNALLPPVVIEAVVSDRQRIYGAASDAASSNLAPAPSLVLTVAPGRGDVEFRYTALSLQAAERNRFRYRLEGADTDWVEADARREAAYHRLPPGHYRFTVVACNNDGVWNESGAQIALILQPHFWQTQWFPFVTGIVSCIAVGGAAGFVTRRKMLRRLEQLERQRAIEAERARIAQDIHDDLGAKLTEISMLAAVRPDAEGPQLSQRLSRIALTSRNAVESMDAIVWTIDPGNDTLAGVVSYLASFAGEYLEAVGLSCRLDVPTLVPEFVLSTEIRHHLFMAAKEALHNAVRHAAAREVALTLKIENNLLSIAIEDNGCGFDLSSARMGNGLRNLQSRLDKIGGRCMVRTSPGAGTGVELVVPLNPT